LFKFIQTDRLPNTEPTAPTLTSN